MVPVDAQLLHEASLSGRRCATIDRLHARVPMAAGLVLRGRVGCHVFVKIARGQGCEAITAARHWPVHSMASADRCFGRGDHDDGGISTAVHAGCEESVAGGFFVPGEEGSALAGSDAGHGDVLLEDAGVRRSVCVRVW